MKTTSGSPQSWKLRREAYKKTARQVSNPGSPSPVNRKARREAKRMARDIHAIAHMPEVLDARD